MGHADEQHTSDGGQEGLLEDRPLVDWQSPGDGLEGAPSSNDPSLPEPADGTSAPFPRRLSPGGA